MPLVGSERQRGRPKAAHALGLRQAAALFVVDEQQVRAGLHRQADGLGFARISLGEQAAQPLRIRHAVAVLKHPDCLPKP